MAEREVVVGQAAQPINLNAGGFHFTVIQQGGDRKILYILDQTAAIAEHVDRRLVIPDGMNDADMFDLLKAKAEQACAGGQIVHVTYKNDNVVYIGFPR